MSKTFSRDVPHTLDPRNVPRSRVFSKASSEGSSPESGKTKETLLVDIVVIGVHRRELAMWFCDVDANLWTKVRKVRSSL